MKILKSENTLNLQTQAVLPTAIVKGLFIRFTGTNAAGQTATEANLGSIRVNYRGQDIVNADLAFFGLLNNLVGGTHEFASAVGAAVTASYYIPFHVPWDQQNGLINTDSDRGTVYLNFPALVVGLMASGVVEIFFVEAKTVATYVPVWLNQNLQAGAAGNLTDRFRQFNISSIYIINNAAITGNIILNRDGQNVINAEQATLLAYSNYINKVETASTLYQVDLNPNQILGNALANNIDVMVQVNAAATIVCYVLAILFQQATTGGGSLQVTTGAAPLPGVSGGGMGVGGSAPTGPGPGGVGSVGGLGAR